MLITFFKSFKFSSEKLMKDQIGTFDNLLLKSAKYSKRYLQIYLNQNIHFWQRPESIRENLKQSLSWRWLLRNMHSWIQEIPCFVSLTISKTGKNLLPRRWRAFRIIIEKILYLCFNKLSKVSISSFISILVNLNIF